MGNNGNNKDITQLWGHDFKRVKFGLDEEQIVSFVSELINERDIFAKRQEHLSSLAKLAERTVAEADNVAQELKNEALDQARVEADAIIAGAEEQTRQMIEEKKAEAIAMAEKEAEAIRANAQQQAELLLEEETIRIQSTLRDTAQPLYRELLSQLEGLKQQVTAWEGDFERTLSQTAKHNNPTTSQEENNIPSDTDSEVSPEVTSSVSTEDLEQTPTTDQSDAGEMEERTLVSTENQEAIDYEEEVELEVLPPVDISKIMGIMIYLDNLPEVKTTELIPVIDKPKVIVSLREPIHLIEIVSTLPEVGQATEVADGEGTTIPGAADAKGKRRKIQITLSGNSGPDEAEKGLNDEVSQILSS